ncbi:hypothetical protein BP5796_04928 [Coleophoma crateriformis]|uniref:Tetratricopeptide-like helical n=1 Tax=Coleophoma crateriformis TaxID=565419 RepID=A0A3D8SAN1_9HELO|nr:hypothetical protein BP5796_04928 [Coleophoma crateriformis]
MAKKQFLKEKDSKKKSKQKQVPATADEYLEAGVEFEEAGEKWRGGDATKSLRFFIRAIDTYDEALKKFPSSFDLAYNKARVQYELTQHPKLLAQIPGPLVDLLNTALQSSRYALNVKQDNADALFNTAQVLTSLAEAITDGRAASNEDGLPLLEEAIELFQRCLALQEYQHTESMSQAEGMEAEEPDVPDDEDGGASLADPEEPPQDARWATIVEPVTKDTLLDTLLAQLETLTTLCGLLNVDAGRGLSWIEEYSESLINQKLPEYVKDTDRAAEATLTRANFIAAIAEANFRTQRIDVSTYERALQEAYSGLDLSADPKGLTDKAEALIAYNTSLRNNYEAASTQEIYVSRWKALSTALESLTQATKLPDAENLAKIHLARGDGELLRYQLGQAPSNYDVAAKNGGVLVKNAEKFYRGAGNIARATNEIREVKEAVIKEALAAALGGDMNKIQEAVKLERNASQAVLEDAVDDGLVSIDALTAMGIV